MKILRLLFIQDIDDLYLMTTRNAKCDVISRQNKKMKLKHLPVTQKCKRTGITVFKDFFSFRVMRSLTIGFARK